MNESFLLVAYRMRHSAQPDMFPVVCPAHTNKVIERYCHESQRSLTSIYLTSRLCTTFQFLQDDNV